MRVSLESVFLRIHPVDLPAARAVVRTGWFCCRPARRQVRSTNSTLYLPLFSFQRPSRRRRPCWLPSRDATYTEPPRTRQHGSRFFRQVPPATRNRTDSMRFSGRRSRFFSWPCPHEDTRAAGSSRSRRVARRVSPPRGNRNSLKSLTEQRRRGCRSPPRLHRAPHGAPATSARARRSPHPGTPAPPGREARDPKWLPTGDGGPSTAASPPEYATRR